MIGGFKHKGLEELFNSGKTRRIRPDQLKKCARIVQLLDLATRPEEMNIVGLHFHGLQGQPDAVTDGARSPLCPAIVRRGG